jgi:hypothetical protein
MRPELFETTASSETRIRELLDESCEHPQNGVPFL